MITAYMRENGSVRVATIAPGEAVPPGAVWIDLRDPSREDEQAVERALSIEMPTREEMAELQVSSRLYHEGPALFLTAIVLSKSMSETPESGPVTFVLVGGRLVTLRYSDPQPFRAFAVQAPRHPEMLASGEAALLGLLDGIVDRVADILERVQADINDLSRDIFARRNGKKGDVDYEEVLRLIGRNHGLTTRARESLLSISRLVSYLGRPGENKPDKFVTRNVKKLGRDVAALSDHATFLASNIAFLLDATLGMISIEQTGIIKIFSVAAVVFLPPTLIASIYGMNFEVMPELSWPWGYPLALGLMVLSAVTPYLFFKRRGWL